LPNASVFTSTSILSDATTTYGGLLSGASYYIRTRTLWNGQTQGLEQNASSYVSLSTATLPVLPSISLAGVTIASATIRVDRGGNNSNFPYEISYSTSSN